MIAEDPGCLCFILIGTPCPGYGVSGLIMQLKGQKICGAVSFKFLSVIF